MTKFDEILNEEYRSRTFKRTERYPTKIVLGRDFLEALEAEYYDDSREANRNFHSNFGKAISFELDKLKAQPQLAAKYHKPKMDLEVPVYEID